MSRQAQLKAVELNVGQLSVGAVVYFENVTEGDVMEEIARQRYYWPAVMHARVFDISVVLVAPTDERKPMRTVVRLARTT